MKRLLFSERKKIDEEFNNWAKLHQVSYTPNNVLCFLEMNKLLNMNNTIKFLEKLDKGSDKE